jgi:hypothetical protein
MRRDDCVTVGVYRYLATVCADIPVFAFSGNVRVCVPDFLQAPVHSVARQTKIFSDPLFAQPRRMNFVQIKK